MKMRRAIGGKGRVTRRVTIENERTIIFRSLDRRATLWCLTCGENVEMLSVEAVASQTGLTELEIHQLMEAGALHFAGDAAGRIFVCFNSIKQPWTEGSTS